MQTEIPDAFEEFDDHELWGTSSYNLLLTNTHLQTSSPQSKAALRRAYDIEIVRTNYEVEWDIYYEFLESICADWFTGPIAQAAILANSETAKQFVVGAAYNASGGVMRCLRQGVDQFIKNDRDGTVVVPARDLKAIGSQEDIRVLRSIGVLRRTSQGYEFDTGILRALRLGETYSQSEAAWALSNRFCGHFGIDKEAVNEALLGLADIEPPDEHPKRSDASLPLYLTRSDLATFSDIIFSDKFESTVRELKKEIAADREQIMEALQFGIGGEPPSSVDWPIPDEAAIVCATASQQNRPVVADYLTERLEEDRFAIHASLREADLAATLENRLLHFDQAYSAPSTDEEPIKTYQNWLKNRLSKLEATEGGLDELTRRLSEGWDRQRQSLLEAILQQLDGFTVSPTQFVFSMLDPNYLDDYQIEQYVDDSDLLRDEVNQIKTWRENQPGDAETFSSAITEVCHYPIRNADTEPILRIMSPWMNFAVQDYTALFRNLLQNGVTIRLLFRLPSSNRWNELKEHLLTRIGDPKGDLELRTYTRFKEFQDHADLKELEEREEYAKKTGVHAKLFIAGAPSDGAVIAGSANLMENSFFYNPEAGLKTHDPNVLETAIDYFDLIWNLSEPDRIDESVYTGKTNFRFYPKVYRL